MITYKDKAWCSLSSQCGRKKCHRNYNEEEHAENKAGVNLPISQANLKTKECGHEPVQF